jgi:dihydroflavonol-4-reductase
MEMDRKKPVLVTGATGYVAGWIVKRLLDAGFTVHAPVRNPGNEHSLKYLNRIADQAIGNIKFFKADLLEEGSYDESMEGCELVFHTASPFTLTVNNPQKDLVDPALSGTNNVLASVNRTPSVKRVVLTSSCAAIIGDSVDCLSYPNGMATEQEWNRTSTLDHQSYSYSKTVAEQVAWEICNKQSSWDLVVINPSLVIGPGINPRSTSESFKLIRQLGDGNAKFGVPEFYIGVVDVRDVADAHLKAGYLSLAKGRYIVSAEETSLLGLSLMLQKKYANQFPFPTKTLPKFLVWLMAPLVGYTRQMIRKNVGYHWLVDHSRSIQDLEVSYRPVEESITEFFQQMIDDKVFKIKH